MTKITIVGMGQMGCNYARILLDMDFVPNDICAFDIDVGKVASAQEKFPGILTRNRLEDLPVTEMAIVASNTPSHARVIEELCARGTKYIFCEKPLGVSLTEIFWIERAIKKVDGQVYTAFLINFSEAVRHLVEKMEAEKLILVEGHVLWGKNRYGDNRPSAGDTEDESVHGAELLRMLAGINQDIQHEFVAAQLSHLNFVDQVAQNRAHELDPSFPMQVDSSTYANLQILTSIGVIPCSINSSFLLGRQVREVSVLLAYAEDPLTPYYAAHLTFDVKQADGPVADVLQLTDIRERKDLGVNLFSNDKLQAQLSAFFSAINGGPISPRLTTFNRARSAVDFTQAVKRSHQHGGGQVEV